MGEGINDPCTKHATRRCGYCFPLSFETLDEILEQLIWQRENASGVSLESRELKRVVELLEELRRRRQEHP